MRKLYLLILLSAFVKAAFSQCTPDPNLVATGFSPAELPWAYTDAAYSQVLSFKVPRDTTAEISGNQFEVVIDSVVMLELRGVPANFTYQCLNRCVVNGGDKGCALLSGQAEESQIGAYRIKVVLQTYFKVKNAPNAFSRIDSGDSYQFRIYKTTGLAKLMNGNAPQVIKAFPNPASGSVQFDLSSLPHHSNGTITIVDVLGRTIFEDAFANNSPAPVTIENWKNGIYKCMIRSGEQTYYTGFMKQ
jgi:hypothetical protein